jgi:uncharacterized protein (DUF433 family)
MSTLPETEPSIEEQAEALLASLTPEPPPLRLDLGGTIRVGATRVRLDTVLYAFNTGCTPEAILEDFPTLKLADIYAIITYYLWHRDEVDAYLRARQEQAEEIEREVRARWPTEGIKEMLLARRAQHS